MDLDVTAFAASLRYPAGDRVHALLANVDVSELTLIDAAWCYRVSAQLTAPIADSQTLTADVKQFLA